MTTATATVERSSRHRELSEPIRAHAVAEPDAESSVESTIDSAIEPVEFRGSLPDAPPELQELLDRDALYELIDGRYTECPEMSTKAVRVMTNLSHELQHWGHTHNHGRALTEAPVGLDPKQAKRHWRRPDVVYVTYAKWAKGRPFPDTDPCPVVPDLVAEVVSPRDPAEDLADKLVEYLSAGVPEVWVIYPRQRWVYVYGVGPTVRLVAGEGSLEGGSVLPGFVLPLARLFEDT